MESSTDLANKQIKIRIRKKLIVPIVIGLVSIAIVIALLFIFTKKNSVKDTAQNQEKTIAIIDNVPVYKTYFDKELELFPGTKSAEIEKKLKQKVINDQITLLAARKQGIIKNYKNTSLLTTKEYLQRTKQLEEIKTKIQTTANGISGTIVSVYFYDNGTEGIEQRKKSAYEKIHPLYEKVKNKQITIQQAGQILATDASLSTIDKSYRFDALISFTVPKGRVVTFWPRFNKMLVATKPGNITNFYVGQTKNKEGKYVDSVYIFAKVDKNISNKNYSNFDEWFLNQRSQYSSEISQQRFHFPFNKVFAEDISSDNNSGSDNSSSNDGNSQNSNDDHPNTCDQVMNSTGNCGDPDPGNPDWSGSVTSQTGAALAGAHIVISCRSGSGGADTGGNGQYHSNPINGVSSSCNPITIIATYNGTTCQRVPDNSPTINIPNTTATQVNNFVCQVVIACNAACTQDANCQGAQNGCTMCISGACRTPQACGTACTQAADCAGARDGCVACTNGTCQHPPPPACGAQCVQDANCAGAQNGCTACIAGICKNPNACGISCSQDAECAGARDGCTMCVTGSCRTPRACGTNCTQAADCAGARDGCSACLPNSTGTAKVCSPVPACGSPCSQDASCAGALNGCTMCIAGACHTVVACGVSCTQASDCAGARDGCTACIPNDTGAASACKPVPACGTSCTKDAQCAGAQNGCNFCSAGKCSAFSEDMCSCDGMDFTSASGSTTFFPGDKVTFIAYGKVPGKDWKGDASAAVKAAEITSMSFSLYQSKLSDPNNATLIAQSSAITPQVVENSATKVRYKITWDRKIPSTVPSGTLFRIQAKLTCSKKAGVLGAAIVPTPMQTNYFNQLAETIGGIFSRGSVLGDAVTPTPGARQDQHADTFFPGAQIQEKTCTFIKFFFQ